MWTGDAQELDKRYRGVTEVDVGGKWKEWFGKYGESRRKSRDRKAKLA